jgi:hypothetical protein
MATSSSPQTSGLCLVAGRADRLVVKGYKVPAQRVHDALMKGFMMIQTDAAVLAGTAPSLGDKDG